MLKIRRYHLIAPIFLAAISLQVAEARDELPAAETDVVDEAAPGNGSSDGDGTDEAEEEIWYEDILVTASRSDRKAKSIPLQTTVLPRRDVEVAPESGMSDIVRQITSLNLVNDQSSLVANHRDQSLNFRGVSGSSVSHGLLLVDGLPLLDPYNGSANWTKVAKEHVDRVEVVSGGGANIWGNLALSGVVNLITLAPSDGRLRAKLRGGSKSTVDASLSYSKLSGRWAGWVGGDYFDTDGYQVISEDTRGSVDEPLFKQYQSILGRGSYSASASTVVHFGGLAYQEDRGEGTALLRATNDEYSLTAAMDHVGSEGGSWNLRVFGRTLVHTDQNSELDDDRNSEDFRSVIPDLTSPTGGASVVWTLPGKSKHRLTTGADMVFSSIERNEDLDWDGTQWSRRSEVKGKQQFAGIFADDLIAVSSKFSLQLAGRFDVIRTSDGESVLSDTITGEIIQDDYLDSNTETTFNPNLGFVYALNSASRIRGAVYTGFRAPMPSELFVASAPRRSRITVPNPTLLPETLIGAEAGYDYTPSSKFNARLTGFWSETEDLIQSLIVGQAGPEGGIVEPCGRLEPEQGCRQRRNLGQTQAYGVEVDGTYRPTSSLRLSAGATFLNAEITDNPDDPELVGNRIRRTPEQRVVFGTQYSNRRIADFFLRYRFVGDKFEDAENEEYLPSYQVVDFTISRSVTRHWLIFGGVENLLDEEYLVEFNNDLGPAFGAPRLLHIGFRYSNR